MTCAAAARRRWVAAVMLGVPLAVANGCAGAGPHENALAQAIAAKDVAAARRAIAAGVDYKANVAVRGGEPLSLTMFLIREMQDTGERTNPRLQEIAVAMFAAGADPNCPVWRHGQCPLDAAIEVPSPVLIDAMVKAGLDVKGTRTSRALLGACNEGHTVVVERLVAAGADVNYKWTRYGVTSTPLSEAIQGRHQAIIDLLERAGAKEW